MRVHFVIITSASKFILQRLIIPSKQKSKVLPILKCELKPDMHSINQPIQFQTEYDYKDFFLLFTCLLMSNCSVKQSDFDMLKSKNDPLVQLLPKKDANVKIENSILNELTSKYTEETYDIYISYPDNYKDSENKYPVSGVRC